MCFATAAKNSKRQDEDHNLGSAIQGCRHNVIVLDEEHGVVLSEIPLSNEAQQEVHEDSRVDADEEITHVPADYGQVDVSPENMGSVSVDEPEGEWNSEAHEVCESDPLVSLAYRNKILGHAEDDCKSVELLNVLSTPDVRA